MCKKDCSYFQFYQQLIVTQCESSKKLIFVYFVKRVNNDKFFLRLGGHKDT